MGERPADAKIVAIGGQLDRIDPCGSGQNDRQWYQRAILAVRGRDWRRWQSPASLTTANAAPDVRPCNKLLRLSEILGTVITENCAAPTKANTGATGCAN